MKTDGDILVGVKVESDGLDDGLKEMEDKVKKKDIFSSLGEGLKKVGSTISSVFTKATSKVFNIALKLGKVFSGLGLTIAGLSLLGFVAGFGIAINKSEELQTKLQQIGQIIMNSLEQILMVVAPVVEKIVNFIYKMFVYLGYVLNAWFGIDAFAARTDKSMKSGVKGAKELRKQLAGFDEVNVLNKDTGTSGIGNAGGGLGAIDTKSIEIPKWVDDLSKAKDTIIEIAKWIGIAFAATEVIKLVDWISKLSGGLGIVKGLLEAGSWLSAVGVIGGIAIAVIGVIEAVKGLIGWLQDPSWETFKPVIDGIATAFLGVGIALIALNAASPVGWIMAAIGAVALFISALSDDEVQVISLKDAQDALNKSTQNYINAQNNYVNALDAVEESHKALIDAEKKNKLSGEALYKEVQNGTTSYEQMSSKEKEVYKAYLKYIGAQENLKQKTTEMNDTRKQQLEDSIQLANATLAETGSYEELRDALINAYNEGAITAEEAAGEIALAMTQMSDSTKKAFAESLPDHLKAGLSQLPWYLKQYVPKDIKIPIGLSITSNELDRMVTVVQNRLAKIKGAKGLMMYSAKGAILNVPKLAVGGIINRPGRGLPLAVGGAIGGERGAEAVVPLTDSQQMALLGEAIGKYVNIRAEVPVYIGNRQIAREIRNINKKDSFLYNGG